MLKTLLLTALNTNNFGLYSPLTLGWCCRPSLSSQIGLKGFWYVQRCLGISVVDFLWSSLGLEAAVCSQHPVYVPSILHSEAVLFLFSFIGMWGFIETAMHSISFMSVTSFSSLYMELRTINYILCITLNLWMDGKSLYLVNWFTKSVTERVFFRVKWNSELTLSTYYTFYIKNKILVDLKSLLHQKFVGFRVFASFLFLWTEVWSLSSETDGTLLTTCCRDAILQTRILQFPPPAAMFEFAFIFGIQRLAIYFLEHLYGFLVYH